MSSVRDIEDIGECPSESGEAGKAKVCDGCPGQQLCLSEENAVDPDQATLDVRLRAIKHKILILSGKGGVGKSSIAVVLAHLLSQKSSKGVGVLDVDICGPSIPTLLGVANQPVLETQWGWKPVISPEGNIKCLSVGSLLSSDSQAVIWRGPRKTAMIKRMIKNTFNKLIDYSVVDTISEVFSRTLMIVRFISLTDPTKLLMTNSLIILNNGVVSREIRFCQKMKVPVLGIVENMSGFSCPCCNEITPIFSAGAGEYLSNKYGVPFLGCVPLDLKLSSNTQISQNIMEIQSMSPAFESINTILKKILDNICK
ncbi:unnamed protein product, partial [Meganyctiphanes norvegica]